jgi:hypothetical protein
MRLLIFVFVGGRTRKNAHFDAFLAIRSSAKHDLSSEPGTQFASDGEIESRQSFEQGRLATGLVAHDNKVRVRGSLTVI